MLFSAGTFVFVAAAHVLPELVGSDSENKPLLPVKEQSNGYDSCSQNANQLPSHCSSSALTLKELCILMFGAVAPSLLMTHHHH
jgi:hypothetical protein